MLLSSLNDALLKHHRATVSYSEDGQWVSKSFPEVASDVRGVIDSLRQRGLSRGAHIGVISDNCYAWLTHDLALLEMGCHVTALTPPVLASGLGRLARTHDLDGVLLVGRNAEGLHGTCDAPWVSVASSQAPLALRTAVPDVSRRAPDQPIRVFSSGTTGTHRCMIVSRVGLEAAAVNIWANYDVNEDDVVLLFLPVANLQQRLITYAAVWYGVSLVLTDPVGVLRAFRFGRPSIILAPPVFYESLLRRVQNGAEGGVVRAFLKWHKYRWARPLTDVLLKRAGRKVLAQLGGRMRLMITGMAPTNTATLEGFCALGLPVYEAYGMTEFGVIASNIPGMSRLGSVGKPVGSVSVEIAADGEIIAACSEPLTTGYEGEEDNMEPQTYRDDGSIATGDIGYFDADGFLYVTGRKKNIIVAPDGQKLHPEVIEREIMSLPSIGNCGVLQKDHGSLVCIAYVADRHPSAERAAHAHIEHCVEELGCGHQLASVMFLPEPFSQANGLLTANLKLNRDALKSKLQWKAA